jgi:hypothetical protein
MGLEWGDDSIGAEAQTPAALNAAQFRPLPVTRGKNAHADPAAVEQMSKNAGASWDAGSKTQHRAAYRWYNDAHRLAAHDVMDQDPGELEGTPGISRVRRPGSGLEHLRRSLASPDIVAEVHEATGGPIGSGTNYHPSEAIQRSAAKFATLSPSGGGMNWPKNPQAAYQAGHVEPGQFEAIQHATDLQSQERLARGAVRRAVNHGEPTGELQGPADEAKRASHAASASALAPFKGMSLSRTSAATIERAYEVHHGTIAPEDAVPQDVKTGAFSQTIANPGHPANPASGSQRATIDGRAHDINYGASLLWDSNRGISSSKTRYAPHEQAVQQAAAERGIHPHALQAGGWIADDEASMEGQSAGQQAIGQGPHREGGKPIGQEGMPKAW